MDKKRLAYPLFVLFIIALPLTVYLVRQQQETRSNAAAPDKLEAEAGVLAGNATINPDSLASGGQYIAFASQPQSSTPGPTGTCTSVGPNSGGATTVPTYHSLGLYWTPAGGSSSKTVIVKYRKKGDCSWRNGFPMKYNPIAGNTDYRGSIVNLTPNTEYEIELTLEGTSSKSVLTVKTWSETFPEGTTTTIPTQSTQFDIYGAMSGTPNAYRVYDGNGATIDVANNSDNALTIDASYVIVRNFTLKGARVSGLRIFGGTNIIIEDCDISNWGRVGSDLGFGENQNGAIWSGAIDVERVTIQRCKMHNPRTDTNSWAEPWKSTSSDTHPKGPQCIVFFDSPGNNVFRYNECYSDATHFFNDGFGGGTNGGLVGFPGPDSDVYNNYIRNAFDDGLEIEGGGRNVRVWNNYVEDAFIPYANASVTIGPFYMWRNVAGLSNGSGSSTPGYFLKSGYASTETNMNGNIYLFNNTVLQPSSLGAGGFGTAGTGNRVTKHTQSRNNILHLRNSTTNCVSNDSRNIDNDFNYDLCNGTFPSGQETNGIAGSPTYAAGATFNFTNKTGDFRLSSSSPGYRAGTIIPNFSDGFSGNTPDIGAQQSNESPMKYGTQSTFVPPQP